MKTLIKFILIIVASYQTLAVGKVINSDKVYFQTHDGLKESMLLVRLHINQLNERYENQAHLLEHMLFKGTEENSEFDSFMRFMNQSGVTSNGKTTSGYIDFYYKTEEKVLKESIGRIMSQFESPLFDPRQIKKELTALNAEVEKGKAKISPVLSACVAADYAIGKHKLNISDLPEVEISSVLHKYYNDIVSSGAISVFVVSSKGGVDFRDLIGNFYNDKLEQASVSETKYDSGADKAGEGEFIACHEAQNKGKFIYNLRIPLDGHYLSDEIFTLLSYQLRNEYPGSFVEKLKGLTVFDRVSVYQVGDDLFVSFQSETKYNIDDVLLSKSIFINFLRSMSEGRLNRLLAKFESIYVDTTVADLSGYYNILNSFRLASKTDFTGNGLLEKIKSFYNHIQSVDYSYIVLPGVKEERDNIDFLSVLEKNIFDLSGVRIVDEPYNSYFPGVAVADGKYQNGSKLIALNEAVSFQTIPSKKGLPRLAMILDINVSNKDGYSGEIYDNAWVRFKKEKYDFIKKLHGAGIFLIANPDDKSLKIHLNGYSDTFVEVFSDLLSEIVCCFPDSEMSGGLSIRLRLLGGVDIDLVREVERTLNQLPKIRLNLSSSSIVGTSKMSETQLACDKNCISYSLDFLAADKAVVFSKLLVKMVGDELLLRLRFEKGLSYDVSILGYDNGQHHEIRVVDAYSSEDNNDAIDSEFKKMMLSADVINEDRFFERKAILLSKLKSMRDLNSISEYYWKELENNSNWNRTLEGEIEQVQGFNYGEFMLYLKAMNNNDLN
ncbi:insulinase family protein [Shewanella sp.]|uniref:insulinase family protein n=1 Tax=Shewanella sp. TaxID=50422 RepID=UPI0035681907